jgi:anti-anti-sigma factor
MGTPAAVPLTARATYETDEILLIHVAGAVGITGLDTLQVTLAQALARRATLVVLDLGQVTALSSLGLGLLVRFRRDLARWNGRLTLVNCPDQIQQAIHNACVASLFEFARPVEDDVAVA